ncbi:60S ribosomal protein L2, mitochondrial-like [Mangifera indica]|uniref:60S ribosomal protein L2, mitochondrial-like n=1 Tax=Mangifera indica TaxID=29780 RepID=UPI001CFB53A2|nr:60S ribosomal protein L2, mitochondrial-like [Mangifera indica]
MALYRFRSASSLISKFLPPSNTLRSFSSETQSVKKKIMNYIAHLDINSQIGSCMPLIAMQIDTIIHNIEVNPGYGGKLVHSTGTSAKLLKDPIGRYFLVMLPLKDEKLIDTKCQAMIGSVSNPSHNTKKLRKAGQSRWLGRRPVVKGMAMNPVDHPHGRGDGGTWSSGSHGRTSLTPRGKPCKSGYKTVSPKKRK